MSRAKGSSFGRGPVGGGVFSCSSCGRRTRSTGRGDNENIGLCVECFDLAGEVNCISDTGNLYSVAGAREAISSLLAKGVDAVALFPEVAAKLGIPAIDAPVVSPALEAEIDTATVEILPETAAAVLSSAIAEARAAVNPGRDARLCAPAIAGEAFTDLAPNCAGLTCAGCEDPHCVWYAAQMSGAAPIALDVHAIARSLWNARPSDYLTNTAARNAWYASVSALSDTIEAFHPGTNLSEFFDVAGVPS